MLKPLSAFFVDEKRCGVTAFFRTDAPFEGGALQDSSKHRKFNGSAKFSKKKEIANSRE